MLGWWICILNLPPEEADKIKGRDAKEPFLLAEWEAGIEGLKWVYELMREGKATELKKGGYPNRYTAKASDVLALVTGGGVRPPGGGVWVVGVDEGEEYALPSGWSEKPKLREANIRICPPDAILTIDAWDLS